MVHDSSRYTVVHARIPRDGRSRHQTWCHDYAELCYSLDKKRPTGCGRSFNHITEIHQCQTFYGSVMSRNNTLGCPPNEKVSAIAQMAGFSNANSANSFAFSKCDSSECTDVLPISGCHGALHCINQAVTEVYTLCTDPDGNITHEDKTYGFSVLEEHWTVVDNVTFLAIKSRLPHERKSIQEDWCQDYAKLCESYGLRPTGSDIVQDHQYTSCRDKYGSVMMDGVLFGSTPKSKIASIAQQAGFASANVDNSFGLAKCTQCPSVLTNSHCEGLGCIKTSPHDDVYTVCVKLQSGFDVLERKTTAYNNTAYIVMKAKVMGNKLLNWRDEYTKTCSHYGGRNVVCKADFTTNSVQNSQPSTTQTPTTFNLRITSSPMSRAQHPRNSSVSSSQPNTTQTPTTLQFWTNFSTKYEAQDSKTGSVEHSPPTTTQYSTSFYLRTTSSPKSVPTIRSLFSSPALSTTMPIPSKTTSSPKSEQKIRSLFSSPALSTIMPIPSKTRAITSASYNWSNVDQRADLIDERIACSQLMPVAFNVGFSNATASNIYIPDSFKDSHAPSTEVVYLLCEGSDSNFDVISTKAAAVRGQEYLIVETKLPQNGLARYETWCEDYKQLCLSYGQRPLGCDKDSSGLSHTACRDNYDAMLPGFSAMTCPSNLGVIGLVNQVGCINGSVNNSFAFSVCNESTCTKEYGNAMALYAQVKLGNALAPKHQLYTMCAASNTSFTVDSSKNVSYQGGAYKIIKARIPSKHISKQETWCNDYQSLCNSYGWRPVLTSHDADVSCERDYRAIKPLRDEVSSDKKLEYLVKIAGYENANVGNIFAFRKKCSDSCFASISDFSQATEPALNLSSKLLSENNNVIFAVCMNSDTNFRVLDTGRINYHNRSYLVLKTKLASHGISKHENWCRDYQRLCEEHEMRPVTILSRESNPGSGGARVGTCVPDYMSIVVPRNESLNLFTREEISIMANLAGYREASRDNSFAFSECNPNSCSRLLNSKCTPGLDCLSSEPRQLYTVCVDSNSNFMAEKTRHIKHKGVPYLIVRSNIPKNGISRHQNWCLDYKALCNSFGMKPVLCENQQSVNNPQLSNCSLDFATTNNSCQLRNMDVLSKLIDESFLNGSSPFMPARCDICNETPNTIVLSVCTALPTSFNVLETRQADYHNARVTIVRTKVLSNGTSFHKNWGHDYNKMCLSLGKRPFSCYEARNAQQHNNREQYNIFLSHFENCSDIQTFKSLVIQAGFSHVNNLLLFQSSLIPGNRLIYNAVLSETAKSTNCSCSNPLVSLVQRNSTFSEIWRECVERRLEQGASLNLTQNCSVARDCLNGTQMANNSCDVILKCYYNNCTECCPLPLHQVHMSDCPTGKDCLDFNSTDEVYAFCSDYSASNFQVHDARDVVYADRPYTVVKAQIPTHGQSRSETWCEDYKMLCQAMGKRPVGCGEDSEILKQSRDCRIHYDAIMMKEMPCPGSEKVADIAKHAGFPASVNESLGLWNCEICSKNFSETWNNISLNVYLLCAESDSNLKVLEKQVVQHQKSPVSVFMTTIPQHGQSFHENWCIDYSQLCRSYGLRPVGCGKSADNVKEHAQCRARYNALMYSDDSVDCSETFELYKIARSAGFSTAKAQNTFIFKSCLPQHCTKFLPSPEHPFTQFEVGSTDRVLYTLCASSDSAYDVIATKPIEIEKQDYLVIRARIPVEGKSKHVNWCEDYKRLCEGYAMRPLSCEHTSNGQRLCIYDFGAVTKSNADLACPAKSGIASIAKQAGFDYVSDTNSFAMDWCDLSSSCVAKMPNRQCVDKTYYDPFFETNATQVNITRADYFVNTTKTVGNETIAFLDPRHCFILQSPKSGEPRYIIDGEKLTDIFKGNTCESNFDINGSLVTPTYFQLTANQTFKYQIPRVETECWFLTDNSLGRMSGEANTVCVRASSESSFEVQSTRTITSSGREYLIIQAKLLSVLSKSTNWCMEYMNLCKAFQSSPLACPRRFGFNTDYVKCVSGYEAIMPSDVAHKCPSNGFVSDLARLAGYTRASQANSFSLSDCGDAKCTSKLPLTGCSHGVHCLNHEVLQDHVYTACVIANSDSNFNVIEKREKRLKNYDYTLIRARLPVNHAPLFESWCKDYERLCKSFDLRPIYCKGGGLSVNDYGVCKQKYSSVLSHSYDCPTKVYNMAKSAGFVGPNDINSFAFHQCSMCSENLQTTTCDKALNCLTTSVPDREVYTVCGDSKTLSGFQPLATKEVAHGHLRLRVIQAKVIRQSSTFSDWGYDYRNLCNLYNELPTGCGLIPGESNDGVSRCGSNYNSHVLKGNELGCNPNDVIAKLARDAGFVNARPNNSFGFSYCNVSAVSQLSSTCHGKLPCLTWTPENPIVYTVCAKKAIESNFKVMGTKSITFNRMDYLVIHAEIPKDGRSNKSNWCHDYKELCVAYDMLPTGCGGDNVRHQNYSSCSTQYDSYMPANDIHGCGDPKLVSNIAKKAGFKDAIPTNSFAFYNCHQCSRELTKECNGALNCISNIVWQRQVYTVCVRPTTAFNVRSTAVTFFDNSNYLVLEAKLPAEGKSISESWCRDYEKLCKSHNARPLFCHKDESYLESARRYTAKKSLLSCDGKDISNIAQQAGFSSAKQENTFILNNCHKCSKELVSSGCDGALSCIHSNPTGYVYAVCAKDNANFKIVDTQKLSISGDVYTVVSAVPATERASASWCHDYTELCHIIGQSPVALHSDVVTEQLLKCRDNYDAVIQKSAVDAVHQMANQAGYSGAEYGNTFAFKDCSEESCQSSPYSYNCSSSLYCLNGVAQKVWGLCIDNTPSSNFYMLEKKTLYANDTMYAVLKVRIPVHRLSKFDSWCRDYERLCHTHNMRPLTSLSSRECSIEYFGVYASKFNLHSLLAVVHLAGFSNATTSDVYSLQKCGAQECRRKFESTNQRRVFYAVCGSLDENAQTNFQVQTIRNVWYDAAFLVAHVRIPGHKKSKTKNWCLEYQTFCKAYDRQPYTSGNVSTKTTLDVCSWNYNATIYDTVISPGAIVERAGFTVTNQACVSSLYDCTHCARVLDKDKCPFEDCQAAVKTCNDFYIICT